MAWPTPQDYNEAVQNPRFNFKDGELQSGVPDLTPLGLPRPITGGFASVYSIRNGSRRWAVRCFLRDFADHKERYHEIGRHLAAAKLPYTVDFLFQEEGIRVRGQWYPILKMEWIEGATFHETIEKNIQNPAVLAGLAERWVRMLAALKVHGIAHCDLQHGNVLIVGGDFRLIDYDGMFVSSLVGRISHEVGHRNYQHPARTENDFGPQVDNFSAWAIYLSLMALSIDPSLWSRYGGEPEHLLFQREDFEQPRYSRLFRSLQNIRDDRIQKYLPLFSAFLSTGLSSVVSPAELIALPTKKRTIRQIVAPNWSREDQFELFTPKAKPEPITPSPQRASVAVLPDDPPRTVPPEPEVPAASMRTLESDLVQEMQTAGPIRLENVLRERVLTASFGAFVAGMITFAARGAIAGLDTFLVVIAGFACVTVCLGCSYVALDEVRSKCVLWCHIENRRQRSTAVRYSVAALQRGVSLTVASESKELARVDSRQSASIALYRRQATASRAALDASIAELNERRRVLDELEADEVAHLRSDLQARHESLLREGELFLNIQVDELRQADRKAFQKWKTFFNGLASEGPPAVRPEDRLKVQRKYDLERRRAERCESVARGRAARRVMKIRRARGRRHKQFDVSRAEIRRRSKGRKDWLQNIIERGTRQIENYSTEISRYEIEMIIYKDVRFSNYILRIFGIL